MAWFGGVFIFDVFDGVARQNEGYRYGSIGRSARTTQAKNVYKNGDYVVEPYTGYEVKTYRCKYSKDTDTLLSKDLEATSKYRKRDGVICQISGSPQVSPSAPQQGIGNSTITDNDGALPPE